MQGTIGLSLNLYNTVLKKPPCPCENMTFKSTFYYVLK